MSHPDTSTSINGNYGSARLRRVCLLAVALGALAATAAFAAPPLGTIEECLESATDLATLPGVPGGQLSAKECSTCETLRLTFNENTRYFIGKEAVSYARLRAAASKGSLRMDVFYRPNTRVLTRVRLVASADAIKQ